jgi:hypothetical protein
MSATTIFPHTTVSDNFKSQHSHPTGWERHTLLLVCCIPHTQPCTSARVCMYTLLFPCLQTSACLTNKTCLLSASIISSNLHHLHHTASHSHTAHELQSNMQLHDVIMCRLSMPMPSCKHCCISVRTHHDLTHQALQTTTTCCITTSHRQTHE